jgi:hypothetical protein
MSPGDEGVTTTIAMAASSVSAAVDMISATDDPRLYGDQSLLSPTTPDGPARTDTLRPAAVEPSSAGGDAVTSLRPAEATATAESTTMARPKRRQRAAPRELGKPPLAKGKPPTRAQLLKQRQRDLFDPINVGADET